MRILTNLLPLILSVAFAAQAQVRKCTDEDGRKIYQDLPCAAGQQTTPFDPLAGNVTTIDSAASREQSQGALLMRDEIREQHIEVTTPASAPTRLILSEPEWETPPVYPGVYPYPLHRDRNRDRDRGHDRGRRDRNDEARGDRGRDRMRPDQSRSANARAGSNYVPEPPTIRQIAPRPPTTSPVRESSAQTGARRDDER